MKYPLHYRDDVSEIRRDMRELTRVGEPEIYAAVLFCMHTGASTILEREPTLKPTLH
jgi:hypothetical protein